MGNIMWDHPRVEYTILAVPIWEGEVSKVIEISDGDDYKTKPERGFKIVFDLKKDLENYLQVMKKWLK